MGILSLIAVAGVVGMVCHWTTRRLCGPGGYARFILVSMMSALVTAWCFFLYNYIELGEFPEPPAGAVIIAVLSFPVSLLAGVPFLTNRWRKVNEDGPKSS